MIQRIQSIWLLLAAIIMASLFYFEIYKLPAASITLANNYIGMVLTGISILLSIFTIFRFKNRKSQLNFIWLNLLINAGLLAWLFFSISKETEAAGATGGYRLGAFIPVIVIVLLFLARGGIRKDEKLLKSLDRLR